MRLITGPPPRRSAPGSRSQGRAAVSGCHLASGASAGAGPPPFGTPGSPRPDDRAVRVAPSGLRPSREQILPGLTRPPPRHGGSRIPAADLVFLIVLPRRRGSGRLAGLPGQELAESRAAGPKN